MRNRENPLGYPPSQTLDLKLEPGSQPKPDTETDDLTNIPPLDSEAPVHREIKSIDRKIKINKRLARILKEYADEVAQSEWLPFKEELLLILIDRWAADTQKFFNLPDKMCLTDLPFRPSEEETLPECEWPFREELQLLLEQTHEQLKEEAVITGPILLGAFLGAELPRLRQVEAAAKKAMETAEQMRYFNEPDRLQKAKGDYQSAVEYRKLVECYCATIQLKNPAFKNPDRKARDTLWRYLDKCQKELEKQRQQIDKQIGQGEQRQLTFQRLKANQK